jgi:hypothetical protein
LSGSARPLSESVERAVARFERRVRLGSALSGLADGALVSAVAFAAATIVSRTLGAPLEPGSWLVALALPPLALAVARGARAPLDRAATAAHLDRRAGAAGLLLVARERDASAWRDEVARALGSARETLPVPRLRRVGPSLGLAALVAGAVFLLPPPEASATPAHNPLLVDALDRFDERLGLLREQGLVSKEEAGELERRAQEVEERTRDGERTEWADVDALSDALERARDEAVSSLAAALDAADALANAGALDDAAAADAARDAFAKATAADLGESLPEDLARKMGESGGRGEGTETSSLDASERARLAEAMREAGADRLEQWAQAGALDPGEAIDLRDLVEAMRREGRCPECEKAACEACECSKDGKPCGACEGCRGSKRCDRCGAKARGRRPGRGGRDRGRADADLGLLHETQGSTKDLEAKRLPPDAHPGPTWTRIGTSRSDPEAKPVREGPSGGAADVGVGEAAWSRRLAPRDRDVVRRFFSSEGAARAGAAGEPPPR